MNKFKLIKKSAKYGNVDACKYVAKKYIIGDWIEDISQNTKKARKYVDIALSKGTIEQNNEEFEYIINSINLHDKIREHITCLSRD